MRVGAPFNPYRVFQGAYAPFWLLEHRGLGAGAKLCYIRLLGFAGRDGRCYPSLETLGTSLGVSERQARDYVKELERTGLIAIEQRGLRKTNVYLFIWTAELEQLVNSVPHAPVDPEDQDGPTSNPFPERKTSSCQDRNLSSGQERNRASGLIGINSAGNSSQESSSSSMLDQAPAPKRKRTTGARQQLVRTVPPETDLNAGNPIAHVILRWAKDRALRRLRSDRVAGLPDGALLAEWAGILEALAVTDPERIATVLDRARAVADGSGQWKTWSFLTLQIQLAAERMQATEPITAMWCAEASVDIPEEPDSEWVQAKSTIRSSIGDIPFANWFEPSRQIERNGTALTIAVPDEATRDHLDIEYSELITRVTAEMGFESVRIIVDSPR